MVQIYPSNTKEPNPCCVTDRTPKSNDLDDISCVDTIYSVLMNCARTCLMLFYIFTSISLVLASIMCCTMIFS